MFVTAIPVVGWIMIIVWAFAGDNESCKNYYRARLAWILVFTGLVVGLIFFLIAVGGFVGTWAAVQDHVHDWTRRK